MREHMLWERADLPRRKLLYQSVRRDVLRSIAEVRHRRVRRSDVRHRMHRQFVVLGETGEQRAPRGVGQGPQ